MTWQLLVAALPAFVYGLFLAYLASIAEDVTETSYGGYYGMWHYGMFYFTAPTLAYLGGIPFFQVSWPLLLLDSAAGLITASGLLLLKNGSEYRSRDIDEVGSRWRSSRPREYACFILFHTGNTSAAFLGLAHGQLLRRSCLYIPDAMYAAIVAFHVWLSILTGGVWWHFVVLEVVMYVPLVAAARLAFRAWRQGARTELFPFVCSAAYFLGMPAVAFSMAGGWHCSKWPAFVCGLWPWPVLMLPAVLYVISLAVKFPMKLGGISPDEVMEAPWAKVAVLATLSVLPVLLEVNVPALCSWATLHLQNTSWQMAEMPRPLWPKREEASSNAASRKVYWMTLMLLKYLIATAIAMLFLRCTATGTGTEQLYKLVTRDEGGDSEDLEDSAGEQQEHKSASTSDGDRRFVLVVLVVAQLTLCTKLTVSASLRGQLNADSGLAWEGYDLCLWL